jgi:hypothetical protein
MTYQYQNERDLHFAIDKAYAFDEVSDEQKLRMDELKEMYHNLAHHVINTASPGRSRSIALTRLYEAKMWSVFAIVEEEQLNAAR